MWAGSTRLRAALVTPLVFHACFWTSVVDPSGAAMIHGRPSVRPSRRGAAPGLQNPFYSRDATSARRHARSGGRIQAVPVKHRASSNPIMQLLRLGPASPPLPGEADAEEFKLRLQRKCGAGRGLVVASSPPEAIVIAGMPNTGTNALTSYLRAHLDARVEGEPPGIWKHLPPFHPRFAGFLEEQCSPGSRGIGVLFTVRNPVTWMLSQTTPGHDFGHRCLAQNRTSPRHCLYVACGLLSAPPCEGLPEPLAWKFPTLLDYWAAYALHLPITPRAMVVRYEDLLHDREAVLHGVAEHFGVQVKEAQEDPLQGYSRAFDVRHQSSSGFGESHGRMRNFEALWGQVGVSPFGFLGTAAARPPPQGGRIRCHRGDDEHHYVTKQNLDALQSAADRGVLTEALKLHDYEVPPPDQARRAMEECWQPPQKPRRSHNPRILNPRFGRGR